MKLSKKNRARMQSIRKVLASGNTLGGLLVSLAATTIGCGCQRDRGPANVMGSYPRTEPCTNVQNETKRSQVIGKYLVEPHKPKDKPPPTSPAKPKQAQ